MCYHAALKPKSVARRYFIRGRVQGVGFRYYVQRHASELGIRGYARNLEDGRVEVYATGPAQALLELEGLLAKGPMWSDVRGVEAEEAALVEYKSFHIER
ncbi:MAG: acylphosphatase [Bryobacterales bacterium]|nr:acylphosphatase [Bryobacterales bacterium]